MTNRVTITGLGPVAPKKKIVDYAISNSFGFGGHRHDGVVFWANIKKRGATDN
ncbi:unnamed protein product [marine sediment metagenome]|uniref:Uncharacterized protein n=1 Tax=marine sediment metagenome TaxID=412755 RepID=X1KJH6_9ZZZZ